MKISTLPTDAGLGILKDHLSEKVKEFILVGSEHLTNKEVENLFNVVSLDYTQIKNYIIYRGNLNSAYYDTEGLLTFDFNLPYELNLQKYIYGIGLISKDDILVSISSTPKIYKTEGVGGSFICKVDINGTPSKIIFNNSDTVFATDDEARDKNIRNKAIDPYHLSTASVANAQTVGGMECSEFTHVIKHSKLSVDIINNSNYKYAYEGNITPEISSAIGLPKSWYHIKYLKHHNNNGFGVQIIFNMLDNNASPKYRSSSYHSWSEWKNFNDGGKALTSQKLETSKKINGVDFDGTKDIHISAVPFMFSGDNLIHWPVGSYLITQHTFGHESPAINAVIYPYVTNHAIFSITVAPLNNVQHLSGTWVHRGVVCSSGAWSHLIQRIN